VQRKPERAPFQIGDRLEYLGENTADMHRGMRGIVVASQPCKIKFYDNGYEFTITAENKDRFRKFG
jgi:hypothetical protein